jgi:hypothetical protein
MSNKHRFNPSKKNHTKNTTVGFLFVSECALMAPVKVENTGRSEGYEERTAVKRRPAFPRDVLQVKTTLFALFPPVYPLSARSVLEHGTAVPLSDAARERGSGARTLQYLTASSVQIKPKYLAYSRLIALNLT